ncbi:MAG: hypothetical protein U0Q11_23245 [Vicinamibacterales bacterium]|mgnify:FL=1
MSPDAAPPGNPGTDADDLGEPIAELQNLPVDVSQRFVHHVRGRIERRVVTADILDLAWTAPLMMLLEFLRIPFEAFGRDRRP